MSRPFEVNVTVRRPQFTITTLLWLTAVVAAFLGGLGVGRQSANHTERMLRMEAEHSRAIAEEHAARARAAEFAAQQAAVAHESDNGSSAR